VATSDRIKLPVVHIVKMVKHGTTPLSLLTLGVHAQPRVTVLGLYVCLSVCLSPAILAIQATRKLISDTNGF
jgi:hypothetical protein